MELFTSTVYINSLKPMPALHRLAWLHPSLQVQHVLETSICSGSLFERQGFLLLHKAISLDTHFFRIDCKFSL